MAASEPAAVPFDIDEVLARACQDLETAAQQKGLEFVVHRSRDIPQTLVGDPVRLGHVLRHLAGNAVKFTSVGEVSVAIDCEEMDKDGGQTLLKFSVTDTGIGVDDRIAALFGGAAPAARPVPETAGWGLAVVDEMVRSMGARIELATASGVGSDFSFTARFNVALRQRGAAPTFAGLRVLLLDDNDTARAAMHHLLAASGCRITAASDGTEALHAVHSSEAPADVLVADTDLAGVDGLEAVRAVLRCLPVPHPPVIAIGVPALREEAMARARRLAIPVAAFLGKPVKAADLYRALGAAAAPGVAAVPPPEASCIDARGALEMLGGNTELFERVLADFCSTEAGATQAVEEMISGGQLEEAGRRVHSVKGTAMVLGLERFVRAAAGIERALRGGDREGSLFLLAPFSRELAAAVSACARVLEERRRARVAKTADTSAGLPPPHLLEPLLDGLAARLDRHSMSAIEAAQQLQALLADTCCAGLAADIKGSLLRLDFAESSRQLARLEEQLAVSR